MGVAILEGEGRDLNRMKFYLSSYKLGGETERLKSLAPKNKKTAYISNAGDPFADLERRRKWEESDIRDLSNLGFEVEHLDLRGYFGHRDRLRVKISEFGVIWEGLGLIDYSIVPHYMSDHPETEAAGEIVEFMVENKMPFRALRDGEVIVIE